MKNKELAKLLLENPDNECIIGAFNGVVDTYSSISRVGNLEAHGVYDDMFNTLEGNIDLDLFRYLGDEVIDKSDYDKKVTYIYPNLEEEYNPYNILNDIKEGAISWIKSKIKTEPLEIKDGPWIEDLATNEYTISMKNDKLIISGKFSDLRDYDERELINLFDIKGLLKLKDYVIEKTRY